MAYGKLPGHKCSKSNLFSKVGDVASGIGTIKGIYDAGKFMYNVGAAAALYAARMATAVAAVI